MKFNCNNSCICCEDLKDLYTTIREDNYKSMEVLKENIRIAKATTEKVKKELEKDD